MRFIDTSEAERGGYSESLEERGKFRRALELLGFSTNRE